MATAAARAHYDRKVRGYQLNKVMWDLVKAARPAGLGKWGDEIPHLLPWAERWTQPRLRAALQATLDADRSAKSTTVTDDSGIVRELVLRVGSRTLKKFVTFVFSRFRELQCRRVAVKRIIVLMIVDCAADGRAPRKPTRACRSAVQLAAEGLPDSATAIVNGLLAVTPVTDPLYPQILYTQGAIARSTADMQRAFQKVAVEYPTSDWADDALLRLAQIDFAGRNYAGAVRGARAAPRQRSVEPAHGLGVLLGGASRFRARARPPRPAPGSMRGIASAGADVEATNRLEFLQGRCAQAGGPTPPRPRRRTARRPLAPGVSRSPPSPPRPRPTACWRSSRRSGCDGDAWMREAGNLYKVRVTGLPSREAADSAVAAIKAKLGGNPFVLAP